MTPLTPPAIEAAAPAPKNAWAWKDYVAIARPDHWTKNFFMLPGLFLGMLPTKRGSHDHPRTVGVGHRVGLVRIRLDLLDAEDLPRRIGGGVSGNHIPRNGSNKQKAVGIGLSPNVRVGSILGVELERKPQYLENVRSFR